LIFLAALFTALTILAAFASGPTVPTTAAFVFVVGVPSAMVGLGVLGVVYVAVRDGRPWSRIALLVLSLGAVPVIFRVFVSGLSGANLVELLFTAAAYGALIGATFLSFSSDCKGWFGSRPRTPGWSKRLRRD
jgi:hypothetical protein